MVRKPAKPAAPKKPPTPKLPNLKKAWIAFLQAHPAPYTAVFAKKTPLAPSLTLTALTRNALKGLVKGKWETLSVRAKGSSVVWVVFADQADFDAAKAHFGGQPWKSNIVGAVDGFSYALP